MFQSRNRVSSNFNRLMLRLLGAILSSFNLVIEYLLISTVPALSASTEATLRFNLVIEYLLISTFQVSTQHARLISDTFQSRNRVSSNFNRNRDPKRRKYRMFQSRNRVSSNFNILVESDKIAATGVVSIS